jgi:hypothetical protein
MRNVVTFNEPKFKPLPGELTPAVINGATLPMKVANPLRKIIAEAENDDAVVVRPLKEREGQCFKFALLSLVEMWNVGLRDATIVHGVITGYHRDRVEAGYELRIAHAWLERGNVVYEATADMVIPLAVYYRDADAVAERRYSAEEAMLNSTLFSAFGPWHETAGIFT